MSPSCKHTKFHLENPWCVPRPLVGRRETPHPAAHPRWGTWVDAIFSSHQYCPSSTIPWNIVEYHNISTIVIKHHEISSNIMKYEISPNPVSSRVWPKPPHSILPSGVKRCGTQVSLLVALEISLDSLLADFAPSRQIGVVEIVGLHSGTRDYGQGQH